MNKRGKNEKSLIKVMNFINKIMFIALIILCMLLPFLSFFEFKVAYADTVIYTNVLEDLQKDKNFNIEDYPVNDKDYSLKVIQVAESSAKELFIYVYQPCSPNEDLKATTIRLSTTINDNAKWLDYNLSLESSEGVFGKYKVENLQVKDDIVRYYDITAIHRMWNEKYDEKPQNDNVINEVVFEVGQLWTAATLEGNVSYTCTINETINITDKYVGYVRYSNGFWGLGSKTDSHYVAFSTNKKIDDLIEADVYFTYTPRWVWIKLFGAKDEVFNGYYGTSCDSYVYIKEDDVATNNPSWIFPEKYVRDRIQSVDDFILKESLSEETKGYLEGKQWILRFFESEYNSEAGSNAYEKYMTVEKVTILRLKFRTDGVTYNLGVVDNKQTGDSKPDNIDTMPDWLKKILEWLFWILISILGIVLIIALIPVLVPVFVWILKAIWVVIKYTGKAIWWVLTLPFKLFKKE